MYDCELDPPDPVIYIYATGAQDGFELGFNLSCRNQGEPLSKGCATPSRTKDEKYPNPKSPKTHVH